MLPWPRYLRLLQKRLRTLTDNVENKVEVKVVGAIMAGEKLDKGSFGKAASTEMIGGVTSTE